MPERERDKSIVEHMLSYCVDIEETVQRFGDSYEAFLGDKAYRNACAMCILQIGELAGHLSADFRAAHGEMPWKEIRGMVCGMSSPTLTRTSALKRHGTPCGRIFRR